MANLTCTFTNFQGGYLRSYNPNPGWQDYNNKPQRIIVSKLNEDDYNYIGKISFVFGDLSSDKFYRPTKLVMAIRNESNVSNPYPTANRAYLTAEDFTEASKIIKNPYSPKNACGASSDLEESSLASSPVYLDLNKTTSSKTSISAGTTLYFIFDLEGKEIDLNKTYYLYLIRNSNSFNGRIWANPISLELEYTPRIKLATPTISTKYEIVKPRNSFTITWNEVPNASSYNVEIKTANKVLRSVNVNQTQCILNIGSNESPLGRGEELIAEVTAIGEGLYSNSDKTSKTVFRINTIPKAPTVEISGNPIDNLSTISFSVKSEDSDGQTIQLYHSINNDTNKSNFVSPLKLSADKNAQIKSGENIVSFYAWDGLEYSAPTNVSFTANLIPDILNHTVSYDYIEDFSGSKNSLISNVMINFTLASGTAKQIRLYVKSAVNIDELDGAPQVLIDSTYYTYDQITKRISFNIKNIPKEILDYGNYCQFAFQASNGGEYCDLIGWSKIARRPKLPALPLYFSHSNDAKDTADPLAKLHFKNKVKIRYTKPFSSSAFAKVSSFSIYVKEQNNQVKSFLSNITELERELDLTYIARGEKVSFYFEIKDVADTIVTGEPFLQLTRSTEMNFQGITAISPQEIKPYTNDSTFEIAHPVATSISSDNILYHYKIKIGERNVEYNIKTDAGDSITDSGNSLRTIIISQNNINSFLLSNFGLRLNNIYQSTVTIIAEDAFGETKELTQTLYVDYKEEPRFTGTFTLQHNYQVSSEGTPYILNVEENDLRTVMFCAGEEIIFKFPVGFDYNNDIIKYEIYYLEKPFTQSQQDIPAPDENDSYRLLLQIPVAELVNQEEYYLYHYKVPTYSNNKCVYYKIKAIDSTSLPSNFLECLNYAIICRTASPKFKVSNIQKRDQAEITEDGVEKITIAFDCNFMISDLGGSAASSQWSPAFYQKYPNFSREFNNNESGFDFVPGAALQIEISKNQNFTEAETIVIDIQSNNYEQYFVDKVEEFLVTLNAPLPPKIFIRFTLSINYAPGGRVVSSPYSLTFFNQVPTVAHRAHGVGINSTDVKSEDILVIENYKTHKYVILRGIGTSQDVGTHEIIIDVENGTISGATINCGAWL